MTCASCGALIPYDARFCHRCGAAARTGRDGLPDDPGVAPRPPSTAQPDGDRRVVTALFADLVDYVKMLAEHDPEVVRARVTTALATMADVIARYDGTREKFIGDAVFAVFGWPRAHDDDAVRAALAALSIRSRLADVGDGAESMEVRIGIATGEVVASGSVPSADGDLGLTGGAITTAARIQSLARTGEILMDGATVGAGRGRLAVEAHGSVVLRGQSTPVQLFGLRGEAGMSAWSTHRPLATGPLVGREAERDALHALLERAATEGRGGIAVVAGDAGVGKTRLLDAMEADARALGLAWTWTENVSYGRGEPYRFARQFAQAVADEHDLDSGSYVRQLLFTDDLPIDDRLRYGGAIAAIARDAAFDGWEEEAAHMPADPAEIANALAEVAARYLDRLMVTSGPRVVVIDDLHWLDPSSVGMVEMLADDTSRFPLVILAGIRPGVTSPWAERPGILRIDLRGLAEPETARLATLVARAAVEADGARSIHERTDGNPLFVGETVRAYLEDGTLEYRDGRVALVDSAVPRMPVTLRAVLGARIDALDPEARQVLGVASVIGIRFDADSVAGLIDAERPTPEVFARLADAALIAPAEDGEWRFAHPLIHDAAYAGLLASRRRLLHSRMADVLESGPGQVSLGKIASHRAAAGDARRALPLLREASMSALALGAAAEAAAFLRQAADLAEADDPVAARNDREAADEMLAAARRDGAARAETREGAEVGGVADGGR